MKTEVTYLGNSGWSVKTENTFLVFDYSRRMPTTKKGDPLIDRIDINKHTKENMYVFISHKHPDHFDKCVLDWEDSVERIKYVLGWQRKNEKGYVLMGLNEDRRVDNLEISTLRATDEGVGFLVKVDGLTMIHFGDHAKWVEEADADYREQVDYIAGKCDLVDMIFLPIAKGSGDRPQYLTDGAQYAIEKLNPKCVFPMHGGDREPLYREFAEEMKAKKVRAEIICANSFGDSWNI